MTETVLLAWIAGTQTIALAYIAARYRGDSSAKKSSSSSSTKTEKSDKTASRP